MKGGKWIPLFVELQAEFNVPAQYLYALAGRESRWNPRKVAKVKGEATAVEIRARAVGLFQITRGVVVDYNRKFGTDYKKKDMLDGKLNATVAAWYLATFVLPDLPVDWNNPRQVALLTQAWNSGPGATKRVLASLGMARPTVDHVRTAAQRILRLGVEFRGLQADKYKWLARRNTKWVKAVARATLEAMANPNFTKPSEPRWTPAALLSWLRSRLACRHSTGGCDGT